MHVTDDVCPSRRWRHRDAVARRTSCPHSGCWRSGRGSVWHIGCPADRTLPAAERTRRCRRSLDELPACTTRCRLARELQHLSDLSCTELGRKSYRLNVPCSHFSLSYPRESEGICFHRVGLCVCVCVCVSVTTITNKIVDGFAPNFMQRFLGRKGRPSSCFVEGCGSNVKKTP